MKVFITGVSEGIGRALALELLKEGHEVWGVARREDLLASLKQEAGGASLTTSVCDVGDLVACKEVAKMLRTANFIPDVFVLNAGVFVPDTTDSSFDFEAHHTSFAVNLDGALFWVAEFLPDTIARGSGTFIAVSSTAAFRPTGSWAHPNGSASYSASKAALSMAFRQFAMSFTPRGLTFSTMHFGPIDTRLWPGRRMFLVPSPDAAARSLAELFNKKSGSYFYPFITTSLLRASLMVPDRMFRWAARLLQQ